MQASFIKHDGFSMRLLYFGTDLLGGGVAHGSQNGDASYVTADIRKRPAAFLLTEHE